MNRRIALVTILSSGAAVLLGTPVVLAQTDHGNRWPKPTPTERPYCTPTPVPPTATKIPPTRTTVPETATVFPTATIQSSPTVIVTLRPTEVITFVPTTAPHSAAPSQPAATATATATAVPSAVAVMAVMPTATATLPTHLPRAGDVSGNVVAGIGTLLVFLGAAVRWAARQ